MPPSLMAEIASQYREAQQKLLALVEGLSDEQIHWSAGKTAPSIAFHVWHLARWADYLQEIIHGRGTQLWETGRIAASWGWDEPALGYAQTGMGMDDDTAASLRPPAKSALLDYAGRAFALAQRAVASIDDAAFYRVYETLHGEDWYDGQIGPIIITWMTHDSRHLGMIEGLIGVQGLRGSADL